MKLKSEFCRRFPAFFASFAMSVLPLDITFAHDCTEAAGNIAPGRQLIFLCHNLFENSHLPFPNPADSILFAVNLIKRNMFLVSTW